VQEYQPGRQGRNRNISLFLFKNVKQAFSHQYGYIKKKLIMSKCQDWVFWIGQADVIYIYIFKIKGLDLSWVMLVKAGSGLGYIRLG
jgi:hypothetical protein